MMPKLNELVFLAPGANLPAFEAILCEFRTVNVNVAITHDADTGRREGTWLYGPGRTFGTTPLDLVRAIRDHYIASVRHEFDEWLRVKLPSGETCTPFHPHRLTSDEEDTLRKLKLEHFLYPLVSAQPPPPLLVPPFYPIGLPDVMNGELTEEVILRARARLQG